MFTIVKGLGGYDLTRGEVENDIIFQFKYAIHTKTNINQVLNFFNFVENVHLITKSFFVRKQEISKQSQVKDLIYLSHAYTVFSSLTLR